MFYFVCVFIFGMLKFHHDCEIRERKKTHAKLKKKSDEFSCTSHARTQDARAEAFYQEYICIVNRLNANSMSIYD